MKILNTKKLKVYLTFTQVRVYKQRRVSTTGSGKILYDVDSYPLNPFKFFKGRKARMEFKAEREKQHALKTNGSLADFYNQ